MPPVSASDSNTSGSSYFTYPVKTAVSGVLRRLSTDVQASRSAASPLSRSTSSNPASYIPPRRQTPPFRPPPLTPLGLYGFRGDSSSAQILSRLLAEEIRLLIPARSQLVERWKLVFSLEQDGASLATLYDRCDDYRGKKGGFVLVVKDGTGDVFGAYLSDPPYPSNGHYYGTGESFLWRASVLRTMPNLSSLPPPPSADTTNMQRMTTIGSGSSSKRSSALSPSHGISSGTSTGTSTPERIRFKAFPYSGVNDYLIFCEQRFLSVGGGDGHYGLWLDASLETGVSGRCLTFGNEPLSEEGTKFEALGVEVWYIGA